MTGKHRDPATLRIASIAALAVALAATAVMLVAKPVEHGPAASAAELTLEQAYPKGRPKIVQPGLSPLYFLDTQRMLGTFKSAEGDLVLVLRGPAGERELRRLPAAQVPEFAGFASLQRQVVWLEVTVSPAGVTETRLWALDNESAAPRLVTADTGDVALFDKLDDVVIHDGQVSWLAAARTETPVTEVRTVPLAGGPVQVRNLEGAFMLAGWPWLSVVNLGGTPGPVELHNLESGERTVVAVQANELMACTPKWCRALIIGTTQASTKIEVLKPDGSLRLRTAAGSVAASTVDVALLDRYEVYSYAGGKLTLFDLETRKQVVIARGVTQVASRGPMLWWTTGDNETTTWHVLDLRELA